MRLLPSQIATRVVLFWTALGPVVGAAVGTLVHLETRPGPNRGVIYHGRYRLLDGVTTSRAYESTLSVTYSVRHPELALLTGIAVGLLAGLLIGLVASRLTHAWPSAPARR